MAVVGEGLVIIRATSAAFDGDLAGAASKMVKVLTVAGAAAAAGAIVSIAKIGMAYEQSLNTFQAVSNANAEQMARVGKAAKDLGSDMSLPATSAADAALAMTELAKAGLTVDEALKAAKGTLQLAAAAQVDEAKAAEISANALNMFNLSADKAGYVADVLANSANASSAEITDMADALKMSGAVLNAAGVPIADVAAMLGVLANNGIKGSDAGTSLKQMFLSLEAPSKKAAGTLKEMGINVYDAAGKMNSSRNIIEQFSGAIGKMTQKQRDQALATIFGSDAVRAANIIFGEGVVAFDDMKAAVERQGGAADVAAAKTKGLKGAWEGLKSQLETVAISIYEKASPAVESFVRKVADSIPKAQKVFGDFFHDVNSGLQEGLVNDSLGNHIGNVFRVVREETDKFFHGFYSGLKEGLVNDSLGNQVGNIFRIINEKAREYLPIVIDMFGDIVDVVLGGVALAKPILDTLFDLFEPLALAAAVAIVGLVDGLGALGRWLSDNEGPVKIIGGLIVTLLIPAIVSIGVTSLISAGQAAAAWVVMEVKAIAAAIAHGIQVALIVGGWILMGITATAQALVIAAAWIISLGPIALVVAAVIGLAIIVVANWETIKTAVSDGAQWVREHLGWIEAALIAVGGPLGILAVLFIEHFDKIKNVVREGAARIIDYFLGMASVIIHAADSAFGWIPGIGDKLHEARVKFDNFRDDVNNALDGINDKTVNVRVNHVDNYAVTYGPGYTGGDNAYGEAGGIIGMARGGVRGMADGGRRAGFRTTGPTTLVGEGNAPEYVIPTDPRFRGRALALMSALGGELGVAPASTNPTLERAVLALTDAVERLAAMNTGGVHVHGVADPYAAARAALDELQWRSAS